MLLPLTRPGSSLVCHARLGRCGGRTKSETERQCDAAAERAFHMLSLAAP